ncbi:hypothetical protein Tco_0709217 [Tanacetum coccineum]
MKAQELKTKTSAQTLIYKIFLQRYQVYQGRLLASFQDDAKYEHVGQDTRSQGGKDDQDKQGKDLKISDIKTKSKDNDKGSRSKITKHEGTSLQRIQRPRPQDLNDKSNLINLMKECHNELTSGEIVKKKITMAGPITKEYISATSKSFISNNNNGKMIEKNFIEIEGTFLLKIHDNAFHENDVITALEFVLEKRGIANMALLIERVDSGEEGVVLSHGGLGFCRVKREVECFGEEGRVSREL